MEAEARGFKFQGPRMKTNNGELNGRNMGNGVEAGFTRCYVWGLW